MGARLIYGLAKYHIDRFHSFMLGAAPPYTLDQAVHEPFLQIFKTGPEEVIEYFETSFLI